MPKFTASFTASFVGLSGYPAEMGIYTSSPIVELEERFWSIRIYPGGFDEDSKGHLSCFVVYESKGKTRASYKITMVNQMNWKNRTVLSEGVRTFSNSQEPADHGQWGDTKFISLQDLRQTSNGHCVDDTIVMRVDLVIYGSVEQSIVASTIKPSSRPVRSLQDDLSSILFSSETADMTITVDGVDLPAHRFLLCLRSDVFRAMFAAPMKEAEQHVVFIEDFELPVVQEMLRYLYTDQCSAEQLRAYGDQLLGIGCKYDIPGLVAIAENHLCSTLTVDNAARVLRVADMCSAQHLRSRALLFLAQNAKTVVQSPGFFDHLGFTLCQEVIKVLAGVEAPASP